MGGRKHCLGPLRTFWELWKATAMGIKQDTEGRLPNLLYQNAGRVSGQTKSKVAECLGVPTLRTVRFGGITGSAPWEQTGKPLHLGGRGMEGGGDCSPSPRWRPARDTPSPPTAHPHTPDLRPLPVLAQASELCGPFKGA